MRKNAGLCISLLRIKLTAGLSDARYNQRILRKALHFFAGICFGALLCLPAHSQNLGRISGIVTDTSGGAIAGATVTVTDVGRGISRNVTTDSAGTYAAPNLIPGTYSVHVVFTGFEAFDRQDIVLDVGGDMHVDVTLKAGEQTQTVTVTGEVPAITTTNAQLSATVEGNSLSELPMAGHQYLQLLGLLPAYHIRPGSNTGPTAMVSNGIRGEYTVINLDGVADQMNYYLTYPIGTGHAAGGSEQAVLVPADAIEEFTLVQNAKAEVGWEPGAQIDLGIKSGTNDIHGSGYALGRDAALTDRNPFATIKPPVAFEDYGGSAGGPIMRDKLFYFFGYEGQRFSVGNPRNANVPTTASFVTGTTPAGQPSISLPDAILGLLDNSTGTPVLPSQLSLNLTGCRYTLSPNTATCTPGANTLFSNTTSNPKALYLIDPLSFGGTDNGIGKVDYHLNEHNNLAFEYFEGDGIAVEPVSTVNQSYWSTPMQVHPRVIRAWWTWVPNSSVVNDLRFGWDHILMPTSPSYDCTTRPAGDNVWAPGSNSPNVAADGFIGGGSVCGFPAVTITGFTGNVLGGATGTFDTSGIERVLDSVSYTHGNHITKVGAEFAYQRGTLALNENLNKGTIAFNTNTASLCAFETTTGACGSTALENFMAGDVSSATLQTGTVQRQFTYPQFAAYIQDDWRILPRLTLNLGLRYEHESGAHEVNNLFGNIALGNTPTGIVQQGQGGALYRLDPWAFAPRFGLAWDITGKARTVLRTSFNIIYAEPFAGTLFVTGLQNVPTGLNLVNGSGAAVKEGGSINLASLNLTPPASPLPWSVGTSILGAYNSSSATCSPAVPCNVGGIVPYLQYPQVLNWNVGVQHAITNSLTLDINYVGTHGQHLLESVDINQPLPGSSNKIAEQQRRPYACTDAPSCTATSPTSYTLLNGPYQWFGQMKMLGGTPNRSNYNALQVVATQHASHGLTFIASYTYSHALDQTDSEMNPAIPQDSRNPGAEYGNATWDLRHRFTFGPAYDLPGKPGYAQMLQGWKITSSVFIDSGRPINPVDAVDDLSGTNEQQDRWSLVGNPHDFRGFGQATSIPCYYNPGTASSTWASACTPGLPSQCVSAADGLPSGNPATGGGTAIASLDKLGCYMMGNSVIVPPGQGTFGNMSRNEIFGVGYWGWDGAIAKSWQWKERYHAEFRAEFYNVTNSVRYALPSAALNAPSTFGQAQATPEIGANSPIVGTGGPRKIQLGLRFEF